MVEIEGSQVEFSGRIVEVKVDKIRHEGHSAVREVVEVGDVCAILPIREVGDEIEILLVQQYRHPVRGEVWEIPAGRLDGCEEALSCAQRELVEETGYRAKRWRKLGGFYTSPGFATEHVELYLAQDLWRAVEPPEGDEISIRLQWKQMSHMRDGGCVDAKTLAALTLFGWHENIT